MLSLTAPLWRAGAWYRLQADAVVRFGGSCWHSRACSRREAKKMSRKVDKVAQWLNAILHFFRWVSLQNEAFSVALVITALLIHLLEKAFQTTAISVIIRAQHTEKSTGNG